MMWNLHTLFLITSHYGHGGASHYGHLFHTACVIKQPSSVPRLLRRMEQRVDPRVPSGRRMHQRGHPRHRHRVPP